MQANYVQRLRLTFRKFGPARFIGHLDLARTLERAFNRSPIPVAYTQGFNPRPRMQMASALPLGCTSDYELADIWLTDRVVPEQAGEQIMARMAPGIEVYRVTDVPLSGKALQMITNDCSYLVKPLDPIQQDQLQEKIDALLLSSSLIRERHQRKKSRVKKYDLRPLILDLALNFSQDDQLQIRMNLVLKPELTGRPDEVLYALGVDPLAARIHRVHIGLIDEA